MIEEAALGGAVDERADETQLLDRANELGSGGIRALHRQHGKARKPLGMTRNGRRQMIVHLARNRDALGAGHEVRAGTGVREHLHGDTSLIHRLQAPLADLGQEFERIGAGFGRVPRPETAPADGVPIDAADQGRDREMLLQRNDTHRRDPRLCFPLSGLSPGHSIPYHSAPSERDNPWNTSGRGQVHLVMAGHDESA